MNGAISNERNASGGRVQINGPGENHGRTVGSNTGWGENYIVVNNVSSLNRISSSTGRVHVLAEPSSTSETSFDIIAVHGIGAHWESTWTDDATKFSWLKEVLPRTLPSCRIISYECANLSHDLAERDADSIRQDLMNNRRAHNRSQAPIIFICSQFGGSLIKELFISSSPQRTERAEVLKFHSHIRGFAFFSTPQGDQFPPGLQSMLELSTGLSLSLGLDLSSQAKDFRKIPIQIPSINNDFRNVQGEQIQSICFYETVIDNSFKTLLVGRAAATMSCSSSEKVPLHVKISKMTKFKSSDDPNLSTVLAYLQILLERVTETERTQEAQRGIRILSLDGGGVRGLFSIMVLEKVLEEVHHLEGGIGSTPKPCEVFDLIGGTSTGGLLAIMLGRLQMDVISCKKAYRDMSKDIFRQGRLRLPQWIDALRGVSWYSGDALQAAIRAVVRERISSKERTQLKKVGRKPTEALLLSQDESAPKCFVCAIVDETHECVRLRTYNLDSGAEELSYTIWEAGRATSAAPLYFPPMEMQNHRYYDGGMHSNNPILETIEEAYLLHGVDAPIRAIVSIGTGKSKGREPGRNFFNVVKSVSARTTDTEPNHNEFMRRYERLHDSYFRLQELGNLGNMDLAAWDKLDEIEKLAEEYLISEKGRALVSQCAQKLRRST